MKKILFTICARAGSKGLKNKNISYMLDVPLVNYTLAAIELFREKHQDCRVDLALSTDSDELHQQVKATGVPFLFLDRPKELATDSAAKVDAIRHAVYLTEKTNKCLYDLIIDLDNTSPLRTLDDIERIIQKRGESSGDVVFSVVEARRNPWFNMVKENDDGTCSKVLKSDFTARQQAPAVYDMNASIYAYSREFLFSGRPFLIDGCDFVVMQDTGVLDIDKPTDFELMQVIAHYLVDRNAAFQSVYQKAHSLGM